MMKRFRFWALMTLAVGLFGGPAAWAQQDTGIVQSENVLYAVSLLDASGATPPTTATGQPADIDSTRVRVKVTLSIPRTSTTYGIPTYARPSRLMFRPHKGPETAFDGSILLVRDAPYAAGTTTPASGFYPMPQTGATNYDLVESNDPTPDYVASAEQTSSVNPARWECTYLSRETYDADAPFIASLLNGESTYEWYVAGTYGIGSFTRVSDIQDAGRKQTFTDPRVWVPHEGAYDDGSGAMVDWADGLLTDTLDRWGSVYHWTLGVMPGDITWKIHGGVIGDTFDGVGGVQLLGKEGSGTLKPSLVSPTYPDGIASVSFQAALASAMEEQYLRVEVWNGSAWTLVGEGDDNPAGIITPTVNLETYTVAIPEDLGTAGCRFRIVRDGTYSGGEQYQYAITIRDLIVHSAAPSASFDEAPVVTPDPLFAAANGRWTLTLKATGAADNLPRGYTADIQLRRRANGDTTAQWYSAANVTVSNSNTANVSDLTASFTPVTLTTNPNGSVNVTENAFALNSANRVTGALPGVYDVKLNYGILGSFLAGREVIDQRESVLGEISVYTTPNPDYDATASVDEQVPEFLYHPMVADLREQETTREGVTLRVFYRSGDEGTGYSFLTLDVPMLPDALNPKLWRADISRVLREATHSDGSRDDSAVYVWAPDAYFTLPDGATSRSETGTEGYLAFRVFATGTDGAFSWFGSAASGNASTMPATLAAVPATSSTLVAAGDEETTTPVVVPLSIPNSHVSVAIDFSTTNAQGPAISLVGSYCQDFNTWDAIGSAENDGFTNSDFREDVSTHTADFDIREFGTSSVTGERTIVEGWIPDEGPLSETSSFTDSFGVARTTAQLASSAYPFYYPNNERASTYNFRQWGAASGSANPGLLFQTPSEMSGISPWSQYFELSSGTELVLRRNTSRLGDGTWMPNAMVRLGPNDNLTPNEDANLKGIGTVSLSYTLSMPYEMNYRARLIGNDGALTGYGLSAGIDTTNFTTSCAPSGISISYYLENASASVTYELRLSQILNFTTATDSEPRECIIAEMYSWAGGSATPIPLASSNAGTVYSVVVPDITTLAGSAFAFWLDENSRLRAARTSNANNTDDYSTTIARSHESYRVTVPQDGFYLAVGSAECAPSFRYLRSGNAPVNTFSGHGVGTETTFEQPSLPNAPSWGACWTAQRETSGGTIRLSRNRPSSAQSGQLRLVLSSRGQPVVTKTLQAKFGTMSTTTVTLGRSNADLSISCTAANSSDVTGIFVDDITVTSWCGDDENRNGETRVPTNTNEGFSGDTAGAGFSAVGVWVRPRDDAEINVNQWSYSGEQVLLMQRSRRNTKYTETTINGTRTTDASLALYFPWSNVGYGPVSFDYCIPPRESGTPESVTLILQYNSGTRENTNFLTDSLNATSGWVNASDPIVLNNISGEWSSVSVTPRVDGEEIVSDDRGRGGTLRLVMVVSSNSDATYDPYVYLDNVVVSDNREGVLASWAAGNARLTDTPVDLLYWKDRQAADTLLTEDGNTLTQDTFAEKAALTTAFQFNNVVTEQLTHTYIDSPLLEAGTGVGRVAFAARLAAPNADPVRLYIASTTSTADFKDLKASDFSILTSVDVANTVYTVYEPDLSKITFPDDVTFTYRDIRRLRLWVAPTSAYAPEGYDGGYGRVLIDRLAVCDPVSPNLRITDVAFSNVAGPNNPDAFVSTSPLSQPVSGASILRVCATVGNRQLVKDDTVRVFFTYQTTNAATLRDTSNSYKDVFNNSFTGFPESPIYRWTAATDTWPISAWFNKPTPAEVGQDPNWTRSDTVELKLEPGAAGNTYFYGDLSRTGIAGLPENSLVRYVVWAVYQGTQLNADGSESTEWYMSVINAADYKEPAWYFPRSLNKEIRDAHNAALPEGDPEVDSDFFSPYFWMYSCVPGEVFLNELNFIDHSSATPSLTSFAEICVPVGVNLTSWRFASTTPSSGDVTEIPAAYAVPNTYDADNLEAPQNGVVPVKRQGNTSANRTFYTIHTEYGATYRSTADGDRVSTEEVNHRNAGWGDQILSDDGVFQTATDGAVTSALLYRPTGGAEHIVIFSTATASSASGSTNKEALADLRDTYYSAYSDNGFAVDSATEGSDTDEALAVRSPWYQTFLDTSWEDESGDTGFADSRVSALAHARRLAVADSFYADANGRYDRSGNAAASPTWVYERASNARAASVSTVDMGGKWVTRRNAVAGVGDNGPGDLTHILTGTWPDGLNPVTNTRPVEPVEADNNSIELDTGAVAPVVQVTPRQVNPDQYILQYSGLTQCGVISEISGAGTHTLYLPNKTTPTETRRGGNEEVSWSVDAAGQPTATLTYDALPFHHLTGLRVRMLDSQSGTYLAEGTQTVDGRTLPGIADRVSFSTGGSFDFGTVTNNWVSVNLPADSTSFDIAAILHDSDNLADTETRYLLEAEATFSFDSDNPDARALITGVRPCTALPEESEDGSAPTVSAQRNQPWWGSGFGFEADYDATLLEQHGLSLETILVFYPAPGHRADWGLNAAWVGANYTDPNATAPAPTLSLEGRTFADATEQISTILTPDYGTRVAQLNPNDGRFASASLVGILGDAYSDIDGNGAIEGTEQIEPAIPYVAWGVYRATFQTDSGNGSVDFLVRQALPGEAASASVTPFVYPSWYAPVEDLNVAGAGTAMPYFYLYSTPPESAWLNEVNIANPAGDPAIAAEVVMPVLRDGITAAGVPQTTPDGWQVFTYDSTGAQAATPATLTPTDDAANAPQSGSTSYAYYTATLSASNDLRAYVLHRPCGAAEGGVWLSADATGGTAVNGPASLTMNPWLTPGGTGNVFNGVTDSTGTAGSVQLVGRLVSRGDNEAYRGISSLAAERDQWAFRAATLGEDNLDENGNPITPDPEPEWNQVAFTITLRNVTYGTGLCGSWNKGYFIENTTGRTETATETASGRDWVYSELNNGNVFSFKPRTGYCFDSIALPPELIGHVMLIGSSNGVLSEDTVLQAYNQNIQARDTADNPTTITTGDWLTLNGRATVERDANGNPTGVISFDREFDEDGTDGDETFADQDDFVITLLFVDEPASANNTITVSFAQGETGAGAWLATQTLFAIDTATGDPIEDKGGETVTFPIWDDAEGNARGEHKDVHGWLYQPLVGDTLGMSVVIDPSRGLIGGKLGDAQTLCQNFANNNTRLYLAWSLIPAATVNAADPTGGSVTTASTDFFNQWSLARWIGSKPSIGDGLTTTLSAIRQKLASSYNATTGTDYCDAAGIVPLKFIGFRDPDLVVSEDAPDGGIIQAPADYTDEEFLANARVAFRTMTPDEFAGGGFDESGFADGLAPFTQSIDMTDELFWQNGAVLRFAIVVADSEGTVYDAQGIANFTSDGFEGYCPWYVPDDQANINAVAKERKIEPSPYAWIYNIAPTGVWLNEFRPTRKTTAGEDVISFGIELAMEASPVAVVTGAEDETITYVDPATLTNLSTDYNSYYLRPKRSLDGWSIALKVAPLPATTAPLDVPIEWTDVETNIPLTGWVPYRRLIPHAGQNDVYDTDYYVIGDTRIGNTYEDGFVEDQEEGNLHFLQHRYTEGNANTFSWFPAEDPLANVPADAAALTGNYSNGALYALQLVRDNGVVADEILFCDYPANWLVDPAAEQLQRAVDIENASHTVSATVRSVTSTRLALAEIQNGSGSYMLVDEFSHTNLGAADDVATFEGTSWGVDPYATQMNTFPGPNGWWVGNTSEYTQTRSDFRMETSAAGRMLALSAQIVGGRDGSLALQHNGTNAQTGRAVSFVGSFGDTYALSVNQLWDDKWFRLSSITKNGKPLAAQAKRLTTFSVADAGTLSAAPSMSIDSGLLEADTDYVLTLVYSPAAARLDDTGALNSEDDGFLDWVLKNDPDAILKQTQDDGVTASEKYWLGFDSAIEVADVNLNFTRIGTYEEDAAVAAGGEPAAPVPTVSIAFTNNGEPITAIRGDGALVLLGKVSLDDPEWRYIQRLYPEDLNGERVLILSGTDCNFFRAVLLSVKDAEAKGRATDVSRP